VGARPVEPANARGANRLHVGVDVGGTFTDVVGVDDAGNYWAAKVPSTPGRSHVAVLEAAVQILRRSSRASEDVAHFIHGTTVATNAIIEQKGVPIGILMTDGFEDTLEIGRYKRARNYDVWFDVETPVFLAPRRRRRGVVERVDHEGNVLVPLDEDGVRRACTALVEEQGVEALAVCYLFSFRNEAHEVRTLEIVRELYPDLPVSLSCLVNPEVREYERLCVTAFDAYIRPVVATYLNELRTGLRDLGITAPLQVMESSGGIADARVTAARPSTTIMSGPAAGVVGALRAAAEAGFDDVISIDIGGTSSDVSLAVGGRPVVSRQGKILTYPVRTPMVDVNSIGAGGGSIAWFDTASGLHVGPRSAGSDPGPACYARGGNEATVTDASIVLGYVDPSYFAGGTLQLRPDLATEAVERIAERLGVGVLEAAWGIHEIVNASMTDQIRLRSVGEGHDPRKFALVLLGGAGPVHGCAIAAALGISKVVVPALPGVLSAFGLLVSDVATELSRTFHISLEALDGDVGVEKRLSAVFARMDDDGLAAMTTQSIPREAVRVSRSLEMRYVGQSFELEVPLDGEDARVPVATVAEAFEKRHLQVFGHVRQGEPAEIVNLRAVYRCPPPPRAMVRVTERGEHTRPAEQRRNAYFGPHGLISTLVYDRLGLSEGAALNGPAIVEQADTTVVIPPGWCGVAHSAGQLIVSRS
jgi:N-methylhydantoinase A